LKINKQILESLIREEIQMLNEAAGFHPNPPFDTMPANPSDGTSRELLPYYYFPASLVGSKAKGAGNLGGVFYANLLAIQENPAFIKRLRKNFQQALKDNGVTVDLDDISMVESRDGQFMMKIGTWRLYRLTPRGNYVPNERDNMYKKIANLNWAETGPIMHQKGGGPMRPLKYHKGHPKEGQVVIGPKYIVMPPGEKLTKGPQVPGRGIDPTKRVRIPGKGKSRYRDAFVKTLGTIMDPRKLFGVGAGIAEE